MREEADLLVQGWDEYARKWRPDTHRVVPGSEVKHLGDEWTNELTTPTEYGTAYGLPADVMSAFDSYLESTLWDVYLPRPARSGLEIGPGGGRITASLLPRTEHLHVLDVSDSMLDHLRRRFTGLESITYHLGDGVSLPTLADPLDYAVSFDVFVHFEPRLVFVYLQSLQTLLRPGGIGIIHTANLLTPVGWQQFRSDLHRNAGGRRDYYAFGVMCPELMASFVERAGFELVATPSVIPRDLVTVFRKPLSPEAARDVATDPD